MSTPEPKAPATASNASRHPPVKRNRGTITSPARVCRAGSGLERLGVSKTIDVPPVHCSAPSTPSTDAPGAKGWFGGSGEGSEKKSASEPARFRNSPEDGVSNGPKFSLSSDSGFFSSGRGTIMAASHRGQRISRPAFDGLTPSNWEQPGHRNFSGVVAMNSSGQPSALPTETRIPAGLPPSLPYRLKGLRLTRPGRIPE